MEKGQQLAVHGWSNDIEDNNSTIIEQKADKKNSYFTFNIQFDQEIRLMC